MPSELKPCPFCNGKAEMEILPRYEGFFVKCLKCKVEQGHLYKGKKSAMIAWNRRAGDAPTAQPEKKIFKNMSDGEFEKWLYEHGIFHPDINESIPCDAVPYLIDCAINELPPTQAEQRWIPCSDDVPKEYGNYLITEMPIGDFEIEPYVASYYPEDDEWTTGSPIKTVRRPVIAWMPLPKSYSERRQDE